MPMDGHEYASVELLLCCVMLTAAVLISYAIQRTGLRQIPVSGASPSSPSHTTVHLQCPSALTSSVPLRSTRRTS